MDANPKSHQTSLSDHPQGRRWCRNNAVFNESAIKALEVIATCAKTEFAASFSWPATPDFDNPAYIVCLVVSDFFIFSSIIQNDPNCLLRLDQFKPPILTATPSRPGRCDGRLYRSESPLLALRNRLPHNSLHWVFFSTLSILTDNRYKYDYICIYIILYIYIMYNIIYIMCAHVHVNMYIYIMCAHVHVNLYICIYV